MRLDAERYGSATSWVLDRVGYSLIVRRSSVYPPKLEEVEDEKQRRRVLGAVRYVIQALRKKNMVFLITKRFVVNTPLVLTYYTLEGKNLGIVAEALRSGGRLNSVEALDVAKQIVDRYYNYFEPFINELLGFYQAYRRVVLALSDYEMYKLEEKLYEYIPFIIIESRYRDRKGRAGKDDRSRISRKKRTLKFLRDIVKIVELSAGNRTVEELLHRWNLLEERINTLSFDNKDPHIESITRRFLERTIQYAINILIPAHEEHKKLRELLNKH